MTQGAFPLRPLSHKGGEKNEKEDDTWGGCVSPPGEADSYRHFYPEAVLGGTGTEAKGGERMGFLQDGVEATTVILREKSSCASALDVPTRRRSSSGREAEVYGL